MRLAPPICVSICCLQPARPSFALCFMSTPVYEPRSTMGANNMAAVQQKLAKGVELQNQIWQKTLLAARAADVPAHAMMLLVPALNQMIDITTTRWMVTQNHPPLVVFLLLAFLSLMGALLIGYEMSENPHRSWLHCVAYACIMSLCIYVIVDLELPRLGLFTITDADQVLLDLQASMR